jgi:hypothetical protein
MYLQVRWNAWSDFKSVVTWDNSSWGEAAGVWAGAGKLYIKHGSVSAGGSMVLAPNTTYHVWVEWTKGSGTNGTMRLYVSTSGTKPAVPDATITTGKGKATARMYVGSTTAGPNMIFDRILVDDVPIGNIQ